MVSSRNFTDSIECILEVSNVRCSVRNFLEVINGERYISSSCDGKQVEYLPAVRYMKYRDSGDILR